jgi:plasmid maintenance system antidote protein VapI
MIRSECCIAIPPGSAILDQMELIHMDKDELAACLQYSKDRTEALLDGTVDLDADTAKKLEEIFGVSFPFWINLEARYQSKLKIIRKENRDN